MQIFYCKECKERISQKELEENRAVVRNEMEAYCSTCATNLGIEAQPSASKPGTKAGTKRATRATRPSPVGQAPREDGEHSHVHGRTRHGHTHERNTMTVAMIAVMGLIILLLAVLIVVLVTPDTEKSASQGTAGSPLEYAPEVAAAGSEEPVAETASVEATAPTVATPETETTVTTANVEEEPAPEPEIKYGPWIDLVYPEMNVDLLLATIENKTDKTRLAMTAEGILQIDSDNMQFDLKGVTFKDVEFELTYKQQGNVYWQLKFLGGGNQLAVEMPRTMGDKWITCTGTLVRGKAEFAFSVPKFKPISKQYKVRSGFFRIYVNKTAPESPFYIKSFRARKVYLPPKPFE